jgi:hypothetical protein
MDALKAKKCSWANSAPCRIPSGKFRLSELKLLSGFVWLKFIENIGEANIAITITAKINTVMKITANHIKGSFRNGFGGGGAGAGETRGMTGAPHVWQKRAFSSNSAPHLWQKGNSREPHETGMRR